MKVDSLDHVNIITADLHGSAQFYAALLGLEIRDAPSPLTRDTGQWLHDAAGRAVLHLNSLDCPRTNPRDVQSGPTGSIHHVALRCSGYDDLLVRLGALGLDHQCNELATIGLRQVFTIDPNGVLLELNFFGD
jgi:catechol 2,3-dioxygenase-like lactoylglutathione lyase family enzyme